MLSRDLIEGYLADRGRQKDAFYQDLSKFVEDEPELVSLFRMKCNNNEQILGGMFLAATLFRNLSQRKQEIESLLS